MTHPEVIVHGCAVLLTCVPVLAWEPGYPAGNEPIVSTGLVVDPANRDDVVSFWHAVYRASDGFQQRAGWNGSFPGNPGTTSRIFANDVERRVNYFRAMCGIPADVRINSGTKVVVGDEDPFQPSRSITKESASQEMAILIAANYDFATGFLPALTHDPSPDLSFWTPSAWNAASKGNLVFGAFGPDAIDAYVTEEHPQDITSSWNSSVGHRRWILEPSATNFGSGDFPGESRMRPPTNVLYVIHAESERKAKAPNPFVPYPPAGFFPARMNGRFWSLSRHDTDFSQARVSIRDARGTPVDVLNVQTDASFGAPTLVWQVTGPAAILDTASDRRFTVQVDGIIVGRRQISHSYDVVLINPDLLRKNCPITGKRSIPIKAKQKYKVALMTGARSSRIAQYERINRSWAENGDGAKPMVIDRTSELFPLLASEAGGPGGRPISGTKSFNLTFPVDYDPVVRGIPEQIFELEPWFHTGAQSKLEFQFIRGIMSAETALAVETTIDQGSSWQQLGELIKGNAKPVPDKGISTFSSPLPRSKNPIRIRFRYYFHADSGAISVYDQAGVFPTGIFIDDIMVTKSAWFKRHRTQPIKGSSFRFKPPGKAKPGDRWSLALESEFGKDWIQAGPFRQISLKGS